MRALQNYFPQTEQFNRWWPAERVLNAMQFVPNIDEILEWSDCFYEWKYCGRCFCECYKIHQSKTVFNRFTTNRQIPCAFWHRLYANTLRLSSTINRIKSSAHKVSIECEKASCSCSLFTVQLGFEKITLHLHSIFHLALRISISASKV